MGKTLAKIEARVSSALFDEAKHPRSHGKFASKGVARVMGHQISGTPQSAVPAKEAARQAKLVSIGGSGQFKDSGTRLANAERDFKDMLKSQHGLSDHEAAGVLGFYRKIKAVKTDMNIGRISVKHGAFLDPGTVRRAVAASKK